MCHCKKRNREVEILESCGIQQIGEEGETRSRNKKALLEFMGCVMTQEENDFEFDGLGLA